MAFRIQNVTSWRKALVPTFLLAAVFGGSLGWFLWQRSSAPSALASLANGENASDVIGQYDDNLVSPGPIYTKGGAGNGPSIRGFDAPYSVALDTTNHRLFLAEANNRRVTEFNLDTSNNLIDRIPDHVLGQADFHSNASAITQNSFTSEAISYDSASNRLFVCDINNNRVMVFDVSSLSDNMAAANVLGQTLFTTGASATTQAGLNAPNGVVYDSANTRLFVSDTSNNRIVVYNISSISNGQNAANVLGQALFTTATAATTQTGLNAPRNLAYDSANTRLFVADKTNSRVLAYNVSTITDGKNAANVLGQSTFITATLATSQSGMNRPEGVAYDAANTRLFVGDNINKRVVTFNVSSITNGQNAVNELGQVSFSTALSTATQSGAFGATSVAYDSGNSRVYMVDGFRVSIYNIASISNGQAAADALGTYDDNVTVPGPIYTKSQWNDVPNILGLNFNGSSNNNTPSFDIVHHRLFVPDPADARVLVYNLDASNVLIDRIPDNVLGQADFHTATTFTSQTRLFAPAATAYDATNDRLFVADPSSNRVVVYDTSAISNGQNAVNVLGQSTFNAGTAATTQVGLNQPQGLAYDSANSRLFVGDATNNRVIVYNVSSISNGQNAVNVLGQSTFTTATAATTQTGLNSPRGLAYDTANNRLFIADQTNVRVLVHNVAVGSITNGQGASNVLGQGGFTTTTAATTQSTFAGTPKSVAYEPTHGKLFVVDGTGQRVLMFNAVSITDGENAAFVLGDSTFTTFQNGSAQNKFFSPVGVAYDTTNDRVLVSESGNNRITFFDAGTETAAPVVSFSSPASGDSVGGDVTVTTTATDATPYISMALSVPCGSVSTSNPVPIASGGTATFTWASSACSDGSKILSLVGTDALGNASSASTLSVTVDSTRLNTDVLGEYDNNLTTPGPIYTKSGLNNGPNVFGLVGPSDVAVDTVHHRLFVVDGNRRVVVYNLDASNNLIDRIPDNVLGQANFYSNAFVASQATMSLPKRLAYDSANDRLFVLDTSANRVTVYDTASISDGENAISVLGQPDFISTTGATTQAGMNAPTGIAYDSGSTRLFVSQSTGNRVTIYNVATLSNGQNAVNVLGQTTFTATAAATSQAGMNAPQAVVYDSANTRVFVAQSTANRVTVYNISSISNGQNAANVLGQALFTTSTAATSQTGMNAPQGLAYDSANTRLFVSQSTGARITAYNVSSITDGQNAANVLGQTLFTTSTAATLQTGLNQPQGLAYDSANTRLYAADTNNNRVVSYNLSSISNGQNAADSLGEYDDSTSAPSPIFTKSAANNGPNAFGLSQPRGIALDSTNHRLFLLDGNNRVLEYNLDASNALLDRLPDHVLGQPDFHTLTAATSQSGLNNAVAIAYDNARQRLFVAQGTLAHRVTIFDVTSITDGENAVNILGKSSYTTTTAATTQAGLNTPTGIAYDGAHQRLFVSQSTANRVSVFNVATIADGQNATNVLGQSLFTTSTAATSQTGLNNPLALAYDNASQRLFVAQGTANRVSVFDVSTITDGKNASNVLGQTLFTTSTAATSQTGLNGPQGIAYDGAHRRLYVSNNSANRITAYDVSSISNGQNATSVLGPSSFTSSTGGVSQYQMNGPIGLAYDASNRRLYSADSTNSRVTAFSVGGGPGMISATTADSNTNGKIDRIVVTFDQDLDGSTVSGSDFTVTSPAYTVASASETSAGVVTILLTEGASADTDATPLVNVVGSISDAGDVATSSSGIVLSEDGAAPVVMTVSPANGSTGISRSTTLVITFSEPMTTTFTEGTQFSASPDPGAFTPVFSGGNKIVTITPTTPFAANTLETITTDETQIAAASGSPTGLLTTGPSSGDWSFTTTPDLTMSSAVTADNNANGKIDRIAVTFNQDINGATVSGADFTVTSPSYTVASASRTSTSTVTIVLTEGGSADTGVTPTVNVVGSISNTAGTATITSGSVVTTDGAPPIVASINRSGGLRTNASSVSWSVTFSETVTGVDASDFSLAQTGVSGASITSVTGSGPYTVTASTGSGDGTLGLNLVDDDTISDTATNALGGSGTGNGNFTGQAYTVDKTAPTVSSIDRAASSPTNAASVSWTVTFSETVTGVDSTDFSLVASGMSGASITSVTGSGPYTVTASSGTGTGTLGLNLVDDDTIVDLSTNPLGGTGTGNGNFTGQVYSLDTVAPTVSSISRAVASPTAAASVSWTVTFSETVSGVDSADFSLAPTGVTGASITSVTGSGPYTVTASTGSGDGTLGLNLVDNDSITDGVGNKLGGTGAGNGNLTGQVYTIDKTAPSVSSINRAAASPTNASSVSWTVTFSETVSGVNSTDFSLIQSGISGASITSVTGSGPYTVTASTGSGTGTLGLNLVDDDSIQDAAGNPLGGTGVANGNFSGQTYAIDLTAPSVSSINRAAASPTNASSVSWTVTFSETVTGVDSTDFSLAQTGVSGASITSVTGSGPYTVTVSTGSGDGTLGLDLADDDSITDAGGNKLGGTGTGNGDFTGQTYAIDKTSPSVSSITRADADPTSASSVAWTVTFSETVSGVDAADFALAPTGVTGASITSVTGSGPYTVTANDGTGSGSLGLNLVDDDSITDGTGNKLGGTGTGNGNFTGQVYTVQKAPTFSSPVSASPSSPSVIQSTLISATADSASGINQIKLFEDGTTDPTNVIKTCTFSPAQTTATCSTTIGPGLTDGPHTIRATARDISSNTTDSDGSFTVGSFTTVGRVSLSRLKAGATGVNFDLSFDIVGTDTHSLVVTFPPTFTVTQAFQSGTCSGGGTVGSFGITAPNIITGMKTGCSGTVTLTGAKITLPALAGTYTVTWANDSGSGSFTVVDDDTVSLTANVDPVITFDIDAAVADANSNAPYTLDFGSLTPGTVFSSGSTFKSVWLDLSTNASNGAIVTVRNLHGSNGLVSSSTPADKIPNAAASMSSSAANYGLCVVSVSQNVGLLQAIGDYASGTCTANGTTNAVKGLTAVEAPIFDTNDAPIDAARARVSINVNATPDTPAHGDYTDTITFIATASY